MTFSNFNHTTSSGLQVSSPPYWKFDGTNDYGRCNLSSLIASGSAFSLNCWFRCSDVSVARRVFQLNDMTAANYARMYIIGSNFTPSISGVGVTASVAGKNNTWMMLTLAYEPGTKNLYAYLNSTSAGSNTLGSHPANLTTSFVSNNETLVSYSAGDTAEMTIFNKTLSQSDVTTLYGYSKARYA